MRYSRRRMIAGFGAVSAAALAPRFARAQTQPSPPSPRGGPPSVISNPPRDFTPGAPPVTYRDPDIVTIDPAFNALRVGNTPIQRLWTGAYWSVPRCPCSPI